jgi:hypothetical protein
MRLIVMMIGMVFVATTAHAARDCEAAYSYNGKVSNPWHDLGSVSGGNKKKKCKEKAEARGDLALAIVKQSFATPPQASCGNSIDVYFDTQVEGKRNSKDGKVSVKFGNLIPAQYACDAGFTLQGTNCVKTVPARVVKPAGCSW